MGNSAPYGWPSADEKLPGLGLTREELARRYQQSLQDPPRQMPTP
ncbi:hypothetical protein [Mycolicibacterium phlei]|nr:hypothetical protein [Mycolicibacterium phlei]